VQNLQSERQDRKQHKSFLSERKREKKKGAQLSTLIINRRNGEAYYGVIKDWKQAEERYTGKIGQMKTETYKIRGGKKREE